MAVDSSSKPFFGWRVAQAAFVVAVCGLGIGFHGPGIFLYAVQEAQGWPLSLISVAVTAHFLFGALVTANLPRLYARFGLPAVTKAGVVSLAAGVTGWAVAVEPWQLFLATIFSGAGWVTMGVAAINAMVSPWFDRDRPKALALAYNGANVGGVIFGPLWVFVISQIGFPMAALIIGAFTIALIWMIAARFLSRSPGSAGSSADGVRIERVADETPHREAEPALDRKLWRDRRFITLCLGMALGLFAQIGLIAHLFSVLAPVLGERNAGFAMAWITVMAVLGRTLVGWLMGPGVDRRVVAASSYGIQIVASVVFYWADGLDPVLLLLGVTLYGLAFGNGTYLPPLIAQTEFDRRDVARVVSLIVAVSQAAYAFAPGVFGVLRALSSEPSGGGPTDAGPMFVLAAAFQTLALLSFLAGRRRS